MALPFAAQAADVGVARRTTTFTPAFSWTGVYIGASGGQVRGGSQNWITGIPLTCNNSSVVGLSSLSVDTLVPGTSAADLAAAGFSAAAGLVSILAPVVGPISTFGAPYSQYFR